MKFLQACCVTFLLCAAIIAPVRAADPVKSTSVKHTAWRVQGTNCTVYLLGSVHVLKREHYPLPAVFENAFSNAHTVVFEVDVGEMMKPETQFKMMARAQLPAGESLKEQLSEETYAAFLRQLKERELPEVMFTRLRPGFAAVMLVMLEMQREGYSPEDGMDLYFFKRAEAEGKQVRGLETIDFQIGLITDLSKTESEGMMKATLSDLKEAKEQLAKMLTAWQTGDEAELEEVLNDARKEEPAIMKRFLTDRSLQWLPQIETLTRGTNDSVVIVGAGHLVGKDGVVTLLQKRGFKVTQE